MEARRLPPQPPAQQPAERRRHLTREDVMTAAEVATLLALPKSTVYELARRGELPCARLGRTIRFLREEIANRLYVPNEATGKRARDEARPVRTNECARTSSGAPVGPTR